MPSTVSATKRRKVAAATVTPPVHALSSDSDVEITEHAPLSRFALTTTSRKSSVDRGGSAPAKSEAARQSVSAPARARSIPVTPLATTIEHHSPTCYTLHLPVVNNEPSSATLYTQLEGALAVDPALFEQLWSMHPPTYGTIKMFGKTIATPRWHAVYGTREYKFSGVAHPAEPIPPAAADGTAHYFQRLIDWVATHCGHSGYDSLLVNWYGDASHYMGPHTDDESSLVPNAPIYSFSYGAARDFVIHDRKDLKQQCSLNLPNNSLLVMREAMQRYYKHSVPKVKHISGRRINITLRHFKR